MESFPNRIAASQEIETYTELSTKVENDVEVETAPAASGFDIEPDPAA